MSCKPTESLAEMAKIGPQKMTKFCDHIRKLPLRMEKGGSDENISG